MFNAHRLLAQCDLETARRLATSKAERVCIDAAAALKEIGACTPADVGYADLGSRCFPHKSLDRSASPAHWQGRIDNVAIAIDSGRYADGSLIGIPYGSKARIILLYLTSASIISSSPKIELGTSLYAWLRRMSPNPFGGMTYKLYDEQSRRLAAMTIHATVEDTGETLSGQSIVKLIQTNPQPDAEPWYMQQRNQTDFPSAVVVDHDYWLAAKMHSRPIRLCAVGLLSNNSAAIDVYIWLAYRLSHLSQSESVGWAALHATFGRSYRHLRQMKAPFLSALSLALAVYPEALVEVNEAGITLFPSEPPVPALLSRSVQL